MAAEVAVKRERVPRRAMSSGSVSGESARETGQSCVDGDLLL